MFRVYVCCYWYNYFDFKRSLHDQTIMLVLLKLFCVLLIIKNVLKARLSRFCIMEQLELGALRVGPFKVRFLPAKTSAALPLRARTFPMKVLFENCLVSTNIEFSVYFV